jgi:hypothetical protein
MKKRIIILGILGLIVIGGLYLTRRFHYPKYNPDNAKTDTKQLVDVEKINNGDLIFQTSLSGQSKAIQLATKSKYSHCGIIYSYNGKFYVFEAVQPVKSTPLDQWIARGKDAHYVIKRLKNADQILTAETLRRLKQEGEKFKGKDYDLAFEWSDDKIYCSELSWKIYQRATGIEIGKFQKLGDFDLTHDMVRQKIEERYGDNIPTDEIVISPAAIFESNLLIKVKEN